MTTNFLPKQIPFSLEELNEYFSYNPETGDVMKIKLTNPNDRRTKLNEPLRRKRKANFTSGKHVAYYYCVSFKKVSITLHRLAYQLYHQVILLPSDVIDHENGRTLENWIDNLRRTTVSGNFKNQALRKTNKLGFNGVKKTPSGKFIAQIERNYKRKALTFDTFEAAVAQRKEWNIEYGYHENHGRKREEEGSETIPNGSTP